MNTKFCEDYPQVYFLAESLNFTYNDIKYLVDKAYSRLNHLSTFSNKQTTSVYLNGLLVRLNMNKVDFFNFLMDDNSDPINDVVAYHDIKKDSAIHLVLSALSE